MWVIVLHARALYMLKRRAASAGFFSQIWDNKGLTAAISSGVIGALLDVRYFSLFRRKDIDEVLSSLEVPSFHK